MFRRSRLRGGVGVVVLLAALAYAWWQNRSAGESTAPDTVPAGESLPCRCERVVDGDTVIVRIGGKRERVRIVGINTPESADPRREVGYFGKESAAFTKRHLEGRDVVLEFKPDERRDEHGRLLAYVHIGGDDFGARLIREGYAYSFRRYPHPRREEYDRLEKEARAAGRGLWKNR